MDDVRAFLDASEAFFKAFAAVAWGALALAVIFQVLRLTLRVRAWQNILHAAYPGTKIPFRTVFGSYLAGVGVNAIVPARGGDAVRVYLAHRSVPGSSYTTLVSTFVVMAIVDSGMALVFFAYALTLGVLPGLSVLPSLPGFDFGWVLDNPRAAAGILFALVVVGLALAIWLRPHVEDFRARVGQAFAVLRTPARYFRTVALWQLGDWSLRLLTIWFFLDAFDIEQSVGNVLLVQVTQSLATLVPISPGGVGTEQALLAYVFRGKAPQSTLLAFSVGMKITLTVVNVAAGAVAMLLMLGTVRYRRVVPTSPAETEQS